MKNTINRILAAGLSMTMLIPSIVPAMAKEVDSARDDNQSTQVKYEVGSHYKWLIHSAIDFGENAGPNSSVSRDGNQVQVLENVIPEGKYLNISVKGDGTDGAFILTNGKTEKLSYDVTDDAGAVAVNDNVLSVPSGTNTAVQNMNFKLNTKKSTAEIAGNYNGHVIYNAEVGDKKKEKSSTIIGTVTEGEYRDDPQFANAIPEQATSVVFTDEAAPEGTATTDLTVAKDGDVVGWLDGTTWKVSTQDSNKAVTFNENSASMFASFELGNNKLSRLTHIAFDNVDTSNVTNMQQMFDRCSGLTSLDLSGFDTSKVTNMRQMFHECSKLTSLDLSSFNTSKVTNMNFMFDGCSKLTSLDLSSFDTSKVTRMEDMFYECSELTSLNLSSFDTSNVTGMYRMFRNCSNLTALDLSSFDTSKVTNMRAMFDNCTNLTNIYVSPKWSTNNVEDNGEYMFENCEKLPNYNASEVDATKAHTGPGGYLTLKQ